MLQAHRSTGLHTSNQEAADPNSGSPSTDGDQSFFLEIFVHRYPGGAGTNKSGSLVFVNGDAIKLDQIQLNTSLNGRLSGEVPVTTAFDGEGSLRSCTDSDSSTNFGRTDGLEETSRL